MVITFLDLFGQSAPNYLGLPLWIITRVITFSTAAFVVFWFMRKATRDEIKKIISRKEKQEAAGSPRMLGCSYCPFFSLTQSLANHFVFPRIKKALMVLVAAGVIRIFAKLTIISCYQSTRSSRS